MLKMLKVIKIYNYVLKSVVKVLQNIHNNGNKENEYIIFLF